MLEIRAKLKMPRNAYRLEVRGTLKLPFEARQKNPLQTRLASGEEVGVILPRGETLRGGDLVTASDGRVIEVVAEPEKIFHVEAKELARIAYQLGSRHVPVQMGENFLRIAEDHALDEMLTTLGASVSKLEAPFEPELHEPHAHDPENDPAHDHDHGHCDHPHHHHRK